MDKKKLVLVGAGEFAKIAYEYFTYDSDYTVVAFSVDKEFITEEKLYNCPVIPFEEIEEQYPPCDYVAFVAIPASKLNQLRTAFYYKMKEKGYTLATYISSHAFVWRNVKIGDNCFIFEDNTVQPFVEIGNNVILWSGNHIGHRTKIKDHCFISSHAVISGYCIISDSCFIGVNSTFNDKTSISANCIVGSGAVVTKQLKEQNTIYIGNPAKPLPKKKASDVKL